MADFLSRVIGESESEGEDFNPAPADDSDEDVAVRRPGKPARSSRKNISDDDDKDEDDDDLHVKSSDRRANGKSKRAVEVEEGAEDLEDDEDEDNAEDDEEDDEDDDDDEEVEKVSLDIHVSTASGSSELTNLSDVLVNATSEIPECSSSTKKPKSTKKKKMRRQKMTISSMKHIQMTHWKCLRARNTMTADIESSTGSESWK
jgi:hypothetical protein